MPNSAGVNIIYPEYCAHVNVVSERAREKQRDRERKALGNRVRETERNGERESVPSTSLTLWFATLWFATAEVTMPLAFQLPAFRSNYIIAHAPFPATLSPIGNKQESGNDLKSTRQ